MAVLTPQKTSQVGVSVTLQAAAGGGDSFPAAGNRVLRVNNASGASINVTVNSQKTCDQGFDHDLVVAVPAATTREIGPFDPTRFRDANGLVQVTYSAVASVTVACVEV